MPSKEQRPPTGIAEEDWTATPPTVQALVLHLLERVERVEARLKQTSRNSSKPPSSDPPSARPQPAQEPSGRKPGGQPGHQGQGRILKPVDDVDRVSEVRPESCAQCGAGSQFVERILTAVTTLRQQRRDVLEYLTAACAAAVSGEPAPSLLPVPQPTLSAMKVVSETLRLTETIFDRFWKAELHRLKGELTLEQSRVQGLASSVKKGSRFKVP